MNKKRITNIEAYLERLVEGSFARIFRGAMQPREVAVKLLRAIEDNTRYGAEGRESAPTQYQIRLHPDAYRDLLSRTPNLSRRLAEQVVAYCLDAGLTLLDQPRIILIQDDGISRRSLHVAAHHVIQKHETTQIMDPVQQPTAPLGARLVINGDRILPLKKNTLTIGRHPDNDLVLSDLRVSRHHVQLRLMQGHYVLSDQQSRGGTYVNGEQVAMQHILRGSDVIRLGDTTIVYEEHVLPKRPIDDTQIDMIPPDFPEDT